MSQSQLASFYTKLSVGEASLTGYRQIERWNEQVTD